MRSDDFKKSTFIDSRFVQCDLRGMDVSFWSGCVFEECNLSGASVSYDSSVIDCNTLNMKIEDRSTASGIFIYERFRGFYKYHCSYTVYLDGSYSVRTGCRLYNSWAFERGSMVAQPKQTLRDYRSTGKSEFPANSWTRGARENAWKFMNMKAEEAVKRLETCKKEYGEDASRYPSDALFPTGVHKTI
jgi:hypothetical protein